MKKVKAALTLGEPVWPDAFRNRLKAEGIEQLWRNRGALFEEFRSQKDGDLPDWLKKKKLPYIGPVTRYHAARNLGLDVAKPDRLMERIAKKTREKVQPLCERLAKASGDRVGTVDAVFWYAASCGIIPRISHRSTVQPRAAPSQRIREK